MHTLTKESQKVINKLPLAKNYSKKVVKMGYVVGKPNGRDHIYSSLDLLFEKNPDTKEKIYGAYFHKDEFIVMDMIEDLAFDARRYSLSQFVEVELENK